MAKVALFVVNGLGLGNSTRCHAVIERLRAKGVGVHVMTSGNGLWYFGGRTNEIDGLHPMDSLRYCSRGGRLSAWRTLLSMPVQARMLWRKALGVRALVRELGPDAVVVDSEYVCLGGRILGVPVAALNNSDVVCAEYAKMPGVAPRSVRAQFNLVERADRLYHRAVPRLVISPGLDPRFYSGARGVVATGPVVRRGFIAVPGEACREGFNGTVAVMLSGSGFGTRIRLRDEAYPFRVIIVGRAAPEGWRARPDVEFLGRCADVRGIVAKAGLVVVNGGFSAVSEMFCLRKPVLVVPVPGHAEQWLNAHMICALGVGDVCGEDGILPAVCRAIGRIGEFCDAYAKIPAVADGAGQAADAICGFMSGGS